MSTKKIAEAVEQARQAARDRQDWGAMEIGNAAIEELKSLRRAARIWQEDLDASKQDAREMHDLFTAIAKEESIP